jgi:hypothetical protein
MHILHWTSYHRVVVWPSYHNNRGHERLGCARHEEKEQASAEQLPLACCVGVGYGVVTEVQVVWLMARPVHLHCLHLRDGWPAAMTCSARLPPNTHRWPAAMTLTARLPPKTQCTNLATCFLMQAAAQEVAARPPWK